MTTEAVVINRIGVALATDSAVTITGPNKNKVFDTGDKLFELDLAHPVGLMINGNMDWLGVPWELLIKDFREREAQERKETLQETLVQFLDFVRGHKAYDEDAEARFICWVAMELFEQIKQTVSRRILREDVGDGEAGERLVQLVRDEAKRRHARFEAAKRADSLPDLTVQDVLTAYGPILNRVIKTRFAPIEIPRRVGVVLKRMVAAALLSRRRSGFTTGIIIAGYAPGDLFPSLAMAEIDGAVCGRLKFSHDDGLTIDRTDTPGRVISFAQTDVADRILSGADQQFVNKSSEFIERSLTSAKQSLVDALTAAGVPADQAGAAFDVIIQETHNEFRTQFWKDAKAKFQNDFNEMVALMPKQETIELAEALVSITAIERKASSEQATVGGPVDVAFISRHEGFVWIKRKHYFTKDLNPRYFKRRLQPPDGGEQA
ncbi:MAG: hypothetical protein JO238_01055 [Alphaproteobacteria bacterium]|nr:hypothetical protein [Alphaproteobacteria bacterium]MBV9371988.1 hypothetical protein [Alphaproteobacteria bacterium]